MNWLNFASIPFITLIAFIFGRNPWRWSIYAYFFGFWMLIPLFLLSKKPRTEYTFPTWSIRLYQNYLSRKELKKINTPDDLLRL